MLEKMMKRGVLTIWVIMMAVCGYSQGPPVPTRNVDAKPGHHFDTIPKPGSFVDLVKLMPRSNNVLRGNVLVNFEDGSAGKFKGGKIQLLMNGETVAAVMLDAPGNKSRKRLLKQLYKQYGDPYKLEVRNEQNLITWNPGSDTELKIQYAEQLVDKSASAVVELR